MKLKSCPFCGRKPDIDNPDTLYPNGSAWLERDDFREYVRASRDVPKSQWCYVLNCCECCGGCGAEINADSIEEVIAKWNRRA